MLRFFSQPPLAIVIVIAVAGFTGARVASAQSEVYCAADINHDGRVTLQEYESWARNRLMVANGARAQRFEELSPERQATILQHRFEKLDINHHGFLDCSG